MTVHYEIQDNRGMIVHGDAHDANVIRLVAEHSDAPRLILCDPPYGFILDEQWDTEVDYYAWMNHCVNRTARLIDCTIAMWGGIGKVGHRDFIRFAGQVESAFPQWTIANWITWKKRRAYGVQNNYLFCREECLILIKGRPVFNIPLLEKKRGYKGYNPKYPAKSEFLRRTNVWTDIPELLKGKIHKAQKPRRLYEVLIETHSEKGDTVYDPCAGSLTTMRAAIETDRRYCVIERDLESIRKAYPAFGNSSSGLGREI